MLSYLDSLGYINETDLKQLTELRSHRNAVAHFTGPGTPVNREDTEYGLDFAERVLRGRYVSVDQMVDWYQNRPEDVAQVPRHEVQRRARLLLEQNFPGAEPADIDDAVSAGCILLAPQAGFRRLYLVGSPLPRAAICVTLRGYQIPMQAGPW